MAAKPKKQKLVVEVVVEIDDPTGPWSKKLVRDRIEKMVENRPGTWTKARVRKVDLD